ncbi:uncharacterized protein [Montipora capricornis]|uniref:uncharacterized protein n=1 Tax=Montipora capricornis TaxID=246305 RepID=UPI0035F16475
MVRCTKGCLKKTLGSARLTYEELLTVLTEVEGVLKSRLLSYVYGDDIEEPQMPSHLIIGRRLLSRNPNTAQAGGSCSSSAKYLKLLLDHFWNRWQKEYLTELGQFHQYAVNNRGTSPQKESSVKEGNVVIVKDEKCPRNTWKLGRVKKLVKGRDCKTRGAVVETVADNQNRLIEISRAVQHLVPVECKEQGTCQQSQPGAGETRTRRQAAIISDIRRRCLQ